MVVERPADTKRLAILDLASRGYRPVQIAGELDVSRQYVHSILSRLIAGLLHDHPERLRGLRSSYLQARAVLDGGGRNERLRYADDHFTAGDAPAGPVSATGDHDPARGHPPGSPGGGGATRAGAIGAGSAGGKRRARGPAHGDDGSGADPAAG